MKTFWKHRFLALAVTMPLAFSACSGAKATNSNNAPSSSNAPSTSAPTVSSASPSSSISLNAPGTMPIVNEPIEVNILVKGNSHVPTNDLISMKEMEKRSGVKVNFEDILSSAVTEKIGILFASGDMPDALMRMGVPSEVLVQQHQNGNIIAVSDYLDQMPNFKKLLDDNIVVRGLVPQPDGSILSMPQLSDVVGSLVVNKIFINQTWLDKLGLPQPKTLDEVYNTFVAFRDKDPNGNGKKDEIAWTTSNNADGSSPHTLGAWRGAFGLGNGGAWDRFDHNPNDWSKLRFIYTAPEMKELLTFINKLYTEGLMDPTIYDKDHGAIWKAHASSNELGSFNEINSQFAGDYMKDFVGLNEPITGPYSDKLWTGYRPGLLGQGNFVVTSKAKNPEVLFRWIDYFYGLEGSTLYFLGIEGETFEPASNGMKQFTDEYRIPKNGLSFDQSVGRVTLYPGGGNPSYCFNIAYGGGESLPETVEASQKMMPFVPKPEDLIPNTYNLSAEDSQIVKSFNAECIPLINTAVAEFVTGRRSLNEFDKYVQEVESAGLKPYQDVIQRAYDKYLENTKK